MLDVRCSTFIFFEPLTPNPEPLNPSSAFPNPHSKKYALFTPPCTPFGRLYPVDNLNIKDDISQTGTKRLASKIVRLGCPKAQVDYVGIKEDGTLDKLRQQYFGHNVGFSRMSSHTFNSNMRSTLPRYKGMIQQVAQEYQLDWRLLAAIAYQESHWNPTATSPTGVRGMMMLTQPTAREIGVTNRLDPLQSLRGGSRYLKNLKRRLPKGIKDPDRTWFALAAYNIGLGHLEDARVITQRQGGDPNLWEDVAVRLPLLQKSAHYKNTRYGYARGVEAATYVKNIRHYQNVLNWQDISENKPLPPLEMDKYLPKVLRDVDLSAL